MVRFVDTLIRVYACALCWLARWYALGARAYDVLTVSVEYFHIYFTEYVHVVSEEVHGLVAEISSMASVAAARPEVESTNAAGAVDQCCLGVGSGDDENVSEKDLRFTNVTDGSGDLSVNSEDYEDMVEGFTRFDTDSDDSPAESEDYREFEDRLSHLKHCTTGCDSSVQFEDDYGIAEQAAHITKVADNQRSPVQPNDDEYIFEKSVHDLSDQEWNIMYAKIRQVVNTNFSDNNGGAINRDKELTGPSGYKVIGSVEPADTVEN